MDSNNSILQKVINDTEKIFQSIAENYPVMLKELERGIKSASESINNMGAQEGFENLNEYLERSEAESREKLKELKEFKEKNNEIIKKLSDAIDEYSNSQEYIEEIRDISESLQVVSLNALCNAVKAGKGGEGFSVITENLKDITVETIEKTRALGRKGNTVQLALDEFYDTESLIDSKRLNILSILEEKVLKGINSYRYQSEITGNLLNGLNSESEEVRSCILSIMEELQQQDLIRQTVDQIILSINEQPEISEVTDENIDSAVFCIRIIELSVSMIEEVINTLGKTVEIFNENFNTARKKLEFIQNEKNRAVTGFVQNSESFEDLTTAGKGISIETGEFSMMRQELITLISKIINHVEGIVEEFESFNKISGLLQNVAVLSRIELSRSKKLGGMRESVDDMSKLVERIQQQIVLGEKETGNFINKTAELSGEYREFAGEEIDFLTDFNNIFLHSIEKISSSNQSFTEELKEFDFFSEAFHKQFDQSEKELDLLKEISDDLKKVKNELNETKDRIEPALKQQLQGRNINDWSISDDNMNSMIEKFTIYSHKKTAGEVSGLDVEESVLEAGEITLF